MTRGNEEVLKSFAKSGELRVGTLGAGDILYLPPACILSHRVYAQDMYGVKIGLLGASFNARLREVASKHQPMPAALQEVLQAAIAEQDSREYTAEALLLLLREAEAPQAQAIEAAPASEPPAATAEVAEKPNTKSNPGDPGVPNANQESPPAGNTHEPKGIEVSVPPKAATAGETSEVAGDKALANQRKEDEATGTTNNAASEVVGSHNKKEQANVPTEKKEEAAAAAEAPQAAQKNQEISDLKEGKSKEPEKADAVRAAKDKAVPNAEVPAAEEAAAAATASSSAKPADKDKGKSGPEAMAMEAKSNAEAESSAKKTTKAEDKNKPQPKAEAEAKKKKGQRRSSRGTSKEKSQEVAPSKRKGKKQISTETSQGSGKRRRLLRVRPLPKAWPAVPGEAVADKTFSPCVPAEKNAARFSLTKQ